MIIAWADAVADRLADLACRPWSPIGRRVWLAFDDCRDAGLARMELYGLVRAFTAPDGSPSDLLVELERPIRFAAATAVPGAWMHHLDSVDLGEGSSLREFASADEIRWLVTRPCVKWRRTARVRFSWSVARFVVASSFADAAYHRTLGIGRIGLA
jgi:hypothetical protein